MNGLHNTKSNFYLFSIGLSFELGLLEVREQLAVGRGRGVLRILGLDKNDTLGIHILCISIISPKEQ